MSKPGCIFYRDWAKDGMPDWCITEWHVCVSMGDECKAFTPAIAPTEIRKEPA